VRAAHLIKLLRPYRQVAAKALNAFRDPPRGNFEARMRCGLPNEEMRILKSAPSPTLKKTLR